MRASLDGKTGLADRTGSDNYPVTGIKAFVALSDCL